MHISRAITYASESRSGTSYTPARARHACHSVYRVTRPPCIPRVPACHQRIPCHTPAVYVTCASVSRRVPCHTPAQACCQCSLRFPHVTRCDTLAHVTYIGLRVTRDTLAGTRVSLYTVSCFFRRSIGAVWKAKRTESYTLGKTCDT